MTEQRPSLIIIPPVEQYRPDNVFLTPDKYAFDFIVIAAPPEATVTIDGRDMNEYDCTTGWANGGEGESLEGAPAAQVHRVLSDRNIGVLVYGFDERVSYGYAAGTQLETISVR